MNERWYAGMSVKPLQADGDESTDEPSRETLFVNDFRNGPSVKRFFGFVGLFFFSASSAMSVSDFLPHYLHI